MDTIKHPVNSFSSCLQKIFPLIYHNCMHIMRIIQLNMHIISTQQQNKRLPAGTGGLRWMIHFPYK